MSTTGATEPRDAARQRRRVTDRDEAVYAISVAADLAGVHPQTLRTYERAGLVAPERSAGNVRRYSDRDIDLLVEIQHLTQEGGLNLAGVRMVLDLRERLEAARRRATRLETELEVMTERLRDEVAAAHASHRYELVPLPSAALERYWRGVRNRRMTTRRIG